MSKERISNTPLYSQESLEDMYRAIEREVEGTSEGSPFSPKFAPLNPDLPRIEEEDKDSSPSRASKVSSLRVFETKYLSKRHRFFKAKVQKERMDEAIEVLETKLKEIVDETNGDLHVVKATSPTDVCAYFISREDADSAEWARTLELEIRDLMAPGTKAVVLEMKAGK